MAFTIPAEDDAAVAVAEAPATSAFQIPPEPAAPAYPSIFGRPLLEGAAETGRQIARGAGAVAGAVGEAVGAAAGAVGEVASRAFSTGGMEEDLAARAPKPAERPPRVATEPELRAAPEGTKRTTEPGVFGRILSGLGLLDLGKAEERRKTAEGAKAVVALGARETGVPVSEYREPGPRVVGQALTGAAEAVTLGIGGAVKRATGFPDQEPETIGESLAYGAGHVAGFLTTPYIAARAATEATIGRYLAPLMTDTTRTILGKAVIKEAATLAAASAAAETGHAFEKESVLEAGKVLLKAAGKGALTGAVFGGVSGTFTGQELPSLAARWGIGAVLNDAVNLQHPFDERPLAQKAFDYGLDMLFLFHGRDPRLVLEGLKREAKAKGVPLDDTVKLAIAEARQKVEAAEFGRLVSVFRRRGQTQDEAELSAAQAILQREAGRVAYEEGAKRAEDAEAAPPEAPPEAAARPEEAPAGPIEVVRPPAAEVAPEAPARPAGPPEVTIPAEVPGAPAAVGETVPETPAPRPAEPSPAQAPAAAAPELPGAAAPLKGEFTLPRELAGAKPRYNIQDKSYDLAFTRDLEKGLYIVAQQVPSKRDADYLAALEAHTGLPEPALRRIGQMVRTYIRANLRGREPGSVDIGRMAFIDEEIRKAKTMAPAARPVEVPPEVPQAPAAPTPVTPTVTAPGPMEPQTFRVGRANIEIMRPYSVGGKPQQTFRVQGQLVMGMQEMWERFPLVAQELEKRGFAGGQPSLKAQYGATGEAVTEAGTKVPFKWAVIDLPEARTSRMPGYPQQYQPRAVEERGVYEAAEHAIAGQLDPEQLGESRLASQGAPILDQYGNVISGNRRTEALRKAFGPEARDRAPGQRYYDWLKANHEKFGISTADFEKATVPVLVRVIDDPAMDLTKLAQEANVSSVSAMSSTELAGIDAGNLSSKLLALFQPSETGQINTAQNRDFVRAFMADVVPASERGRYLTPDGSLSQEGLARIRNALFAKAYGKNLVAPLAENLNENIRNVLMALQNIAPRVVAVESRIATIAPQLLLSKEIADAALKLSELRGSSDPDALKNYLGKPVYSEKGVVLTQPSLIPDESISQVAKSILALFDAQAKRSKRIQEALTNYYERVDAAVADPNQGELAGLPPQDLTRDNFWEAAVRKVERDAPEQGSLYPTQPGRGGEDLGAAPGADAAVAAAPPAELPSAAAPQAGPPAAATVPSPPSGGGARGGRGEAPAPAVGGPGVKIFDMTAAEAAKKRLQAKLNKPIETLAIGADEADDIIDDLVDYGGTVYEAGSTDFDTWAREIRSTLGEGVEEYLRPAFEGIRARMEASRGQAAQGAVPEAPAGPAGVAGQAGPAPPGPGAGPVERHPERPGDERTRRIITARDDVTPTVDESVIPQSLAQHLTPAQRQGVAASLKALEEVGAFANADMTGVGKTREQIAAAKILADRGHKVVIVSPQQVLQLRKLKDQWAFSGSYKKDADAMGVVLKPWTSGPVEAGAVTYVTSYHRFQNLPVDDNTVMIWDEAHKLKNISSETSKTGLRMIRASGGNLFFSATPADMAHHVHYMVESGLFGKVSAADVFKRMGLIQRKQRTPKGAVMIWEANPALGLQKVLENMEKEFTELTRQGRMIKREIALDGVTVLFTAIPPSPGAMMVQNKIETAYINEYGDRLVGIRRASMLQHQRRALETFKVEQTIAAIKASLAENRKVVVFMARVNYSEVAIKRVVRDAFGNVVGEERDVVHQSDGTVKLMREALAREGITDISEIHGGASGTTGSMDDFQAGKTRVVLATVEKGGTGINLDDVVGNAPRDMVIVTSPFSAVDMVQAIGRVWRMTTKSYPRIHVLYADTNIDSWNMGIIARKMKMLNAVVSGDVPALDVGTQGIGEGDFIGGTGEEQMGVEEPLEVTPEQEVVPEREGMAVGGARTPTRPAPPQSQVRRMFGTKAADTPRKDQMIQAMAEALRMAKSGALAIQGHVVGKGVLGWRHKLSGNIRARKGTDVDTFAHEFGHGLQGTSMVRGVMTGLQISNQELQPFAAEMDALTQVQGVKGPKLSEGFAEFARLYATDPALARQVAPTFYPWFESRLATVPDLEQAFNAFRDQILALRASTPEERIGRMIATREKRPLIERAKQAASIGELQRQGQEHIFQFVNRWLPFQQMVQLVDPEGTKLAADQDPNKLGRTMGGSIYNAHAALMGDPDHPSVPQGRLDPTTDEPIPGTKSFFQILKPVGNRINDFRTYAMARVMESRAMSDRPIYQQQAEHLRKLGDLSSVDVADVIARLEATHPDFNGVMDEWQGFNDAFLEWVGSSDLKGPQEIAAIKDAIELYVPLGRLMDNPGDPQAVGALGTKVGLGKGFHRTRGTSERIVLDPLELYQSNLLAIISAVKRNEVLARTLDLTENKALATGKFLGMQLEKVATPMKATTVQLASFRRELEDAFRDAGISLDILDQLDLNRLATIFRPSRDNLPANEMVVYRRGTPHVVQILNPMLMRSIGALTGKDMPMMAENTAWATMAFNTFLRGPARMLRRGVVLSPSFMPAHMAREQQEAMAAGWGPIPPFFRGILESDKTYRRFLAGGGRIFSYRNVSPEALARNIQDLKDGAWYQGKLRRDVRHWAEKILRVWDETTRVGVAGLAIEKARPVDVLAGRRSVNIEAGYQAREAGIDFDLHGANQQFRRYMQAVTFMNPAFQGMYRNARMFREMYRNPAGRIGRGMLYIGGLTMFAEILGYLLNKDDPRYQALTDEQRNMNFYLIPPGLRIASDEWETLSLEDQERRSNEMFSMPKAYGLGWVFATAPRQILEWANGSEPALFQRLAKSFWQASRVEALPTVVRVIGEIATNKDFYFNRDINKTWQRNLPPPMQGRPGGPAGAVELSKAFQSVPGLNKLTPNDIEHIFRGLAGYYGQYALSATDRILALTKGDPAAPEMRLAEYPGVNRFLARFPPTFSKPQEEFYDFYKQVTGAMQALRGLPESQQESFRAAHEFELQESGVVAGHAAQLKNQRRTLDRIRTDTTMDAATKANARERVLLESFNESRRVMQEIRRDRVAYDESRQLEYAR